MKTSKTRNTSQIVQRHGVPKRLCCDTFEFLNTLCDFRGRRFECLELVLVVICSVSVPFFKLLVRQRSVVISICFLKRVSRRCLGEFLSRTCVPSRDCFGFVWVAMILCLSAFNCPMLRKIERVKDRYVDVILRVIFRDVSNILRTLHLNLSLWFCVKHDLEHSSQILLHL